MNTERNRLLGKSDLCTLKEALVSLGKEVQWKKKKAIAHLEKRRSMGHLPASASLAYYERIITEVVSQNDNALYIYEFGSRRYYVVRGFFGEQEWLVIFGADGTMETAFPPEDTDDYINKRGFLLIGLVKEVFQWTVEPGS